MYVKTSTGGWQQVKAMYVKTLTNAWSQIQNAYTKTTSVWQLVFSSTSDIEKTVTLSQSTNSTTGLVTLTGTNYYWNNTPTTLTYQFQHYNLFTGSWETMSSGTATNPSIGSSNTYTYLVDSSYVNANY